MSRPDDYLGMPVTNSQYERIGKVVRVHEHLVTGEAEYVTVRIGGFFSGGGHTIVPLHTAQIRKDSIVVPYSRVDVQSAPQWSINASLTDEEREQYKNYYGVPPEVATPPTEPIATPEPEPAPPIDYPESVGPVGPAEPVPPVAVPVEEEEVIRSEEELDVGVETVETERVTIKKTVVTEPQTIEVPVSHEEVVVERIPIADELVTNTPLRPEEHEVTLHQERPVVSKHTVAKERVRLHKEVVEETAVVQENVSKERVEIEEAPPVPPTPRTFAAEVPVTDQPIEPSGVEPTPPGSVEPVEPPVETPPVTDPVEPPVRPVDGSTDAPPSIPDEVSREREKEHREHPTHPTHPHGGPPGRAGKDKKDKRNH